ncbi:acyl carrier protein [Streptomyces sp. NPDC057702]|uniref:acyl carrier protein n=1 Tax=unclassified Streptomyces TaxID=2593676 RepID=UPI0036B2B5D9
MSGIGIDDLRAILADCAGEDHQDGRGDDFVDTPFADLGYDSLALLETAAHVSRRYGVSLDDDTVTALHTPREFLDKINQSASLRA